MTFRKRSPTVIKGEPDWNALPSNVPHAITTLIRGCLRKSTKQRIGDISTARFVLGEPDALTQPAVGVTGFSNVIAGARAMLVVGGVLVGAILAAALVWRLRPSPTAPVTRFAVTLPQGQLLNPNRRAIAISPDGSSSCLCGEWPALSPVHVRAGTQRTTRNRPGHQSRVLARRSFDRVLGGFDAQTAARRHCRHGDHDLRSRCGTLEHLVERCRHRLFRVGSTGIMRVSPNGGKPEVLVDLSKSDELADGPQFLPDGRTLLFSVAKRTGAVDQSLGHSAGRRAGSRDRCAQDTDRGGKPCRGTFRPDISPTCREERCSPCRSISAASR